MKFKIKGLIFDVNLNNLVSLKVKRTINSVSSQETFKTDIVIQHISNFASLCQQILKP